MKFYMIVLLLFAVGPARADRKITTSSPLTVQHSRVTRTPHWQRYREHCWHQPNLLPDINIRDDFDMDRYEHHYKDIVWLLEEENGETRYEFDEAIIEAVREDVIPELCYLTPDNITVYNSFLLDRTCLEEFENVSPQCRGFKCQLAHYFLEHGARIFGEFFKTNNLKDAIQVIEKEMSAGFRELNMCTCGREFFKAAFKCAPYYYANALFALVKCKGDVPYYGKFTSNVDLKSTSKVFDRLMEGVCAETGSGMCLSSILNAIGEFGEMLETTIDDYDRYDEGDRKFQKSQEKRCDALFGPLRTWEKDDDRDFDRVNSNLQEKDFMETLFNSTSAVANSFFCDKSCKSTRHVFYPCCLKKVLEDKKMWDNVEKAVESVLRVVPALRTDFYFYGIDNWDTEFSEEDYEYYMTWTLPKRVREVFMRTVHGAKYCKGKIIRCNKD